MSALLNWFEQTYRPFGQSNMIHTLDFCSDQLEKHKCEGVSVVEMLVLFWAELRKELSKFEIFT